MCIIIGLAFLSPRLALAVWWIFGDRVDSAFDSWFVPLLGLIFLPWTTLAYVVAWQPGGISGGWDVVLIFIGIAADAMTYINRAAAKAVRTGR